MEAAVADAVDDFARRPLAHRPRARPVSRAGLRQMRRDQRATLGRSDRSGIG
jgi:hypothetical protein